MTVLWHFAVNEVRKILLKFFGRAVFEQSIIFFCFFALIVVAALKYHSALNCILILLP